MINTDLRTRVLIRFNRYINNRNEYSTYIRKNHDCSARRYYWRKILDEIWTEIKISMRSDHEGEVAFAKLMYKNLNAFLQWYTCMPLDGDVMSCKDYSPKISYVKEMVKLINYNKEWQIGTKV